jgi:glucosamine--fructose-6-phosphate aminotransferase (isomerizing)
MSVWNDIESEAPNLAQVLDAHERDTSGVVARAADVLRQANQIVYCGVGTGLNSCIPAVYYLLANGKAAQYLDATEAVYDVLPGLSAAAIVLNTRSGETAELVKLAQMATATGIPTVAVTNEPASTVGQLADIVVPTHSRWDELVVLSAYGGMLATELLVAGRIVGKQAEMVRDLRQAVHAVEATLARAVEAREEMRALVGDARPIYLLGRGASLAAALSGQLVLEEMSKRPAIGMAAGLFRQGPFEVVDESFRAIIFEGVGPHAALNRSLAQTLLECGARLIWIGGTRIDGALNLHLPDLPAHALELPAVVPCHVLAHDLARAAGIEPGTVRFIKRVITSEEGLPNS